MRCRPQRRGGSLRISAAIRDRPVIEKIFKYLRLEP